MIGLSSELVTGLLSGRFFTPAGASHAARGLELGVSAVVPVDLHIRGCPPSPTALLRGLLALVESAR